MYNVIKINVVNFVLHCKNVVLNSMCCEALSYLYSAKKLGDHLRLRGTTYDGTSCPRGTTCSDTSSPGGTTYCNTSGPGGTACRADH